MDSQDQDLHPLSTVQLGLALAGSDSLAEAEAALGPAEREQLAQYQVAKRRQDFLLGRLAAKRALRQLCSDPVALNQLVVSRQPDGAPLASLPHGAGQGWHLSISHSQGVAIATAAPFPIGVDLEAIRDMPENTHRFFLTDEERAALGTGAWGELDALGAWGVKEATYKLTRGQAGGLHAMHLEPRGTGTVHVVHPQGVAVAHHLRGGQFGLALAYGSSDMPNGRERGLLMLMESALKRIEGAILRVYKQVNGCVGR